MIFHVFSIMKCINLGVITHVMLPNYEDPLKAFSPVSQNRSRQLQGENTCTSRAQIVSNSNIMHAA